MNAFYAYGKRWLERRGILLPGSTLAWVKALGGGEALETAYRTALDQAKDPDEVLLITAGILQAFAEKITGRQIPDKVCFHIVNRRAVCHQAVCYKVPKPTGNRTIGEYIETTDSITKAKS